MTILKTFAFELQPAGGPFDDPALLVSPNNSDHSLLLDCGTLQNLKTRDLQKVRWLFLSHLHIDHLIGFDHLLRVRLFSPIPLTVYGPTGTLEVLAHRLRGYAWNLTSGSPFVVRVFEFGPDGAASEFRCHDSFVGMSIKDLREAPGPDGRVLLSQDVVVSSHPVEHGVPCLAYRVNREFPPKFSLETAQSLGLNPGPWVKTLIEGGQVRCLVDDIERDEVWLASQLLSPARRFGLGFLTDTKLSSDLSALLADFFRGVDVLCSESAYLESEADMAEKNLHMTTTQVAGLAKACQTSELRLFHLSRRHQESGPEPHLREARSVFENAHLLGSQETPQ